MKRYLATFGGLFIGLCLPIAACSSDNNANPPKNDASAADAAGVDSPPSSGDSNQGDGGFRTIQWPPDKSQLKPGQLLLTASGEALAQQGYKFPDMPANGVFADGWEVHFQHFIATFDKITISGNPDKSKTDQSLTDPPVAEADGPWAVDLAKPTSHDIDGKETGEKATPFAVLSSQNLLPGSPPFATDGTKYAVGFSAVVAAPNAIIVNLDAEGMTMYQDMIGKGCAVLYVGTATFNADPTQCTTQDPEFSRFPKAVNFSLCFKSPTQYINCDNQDIMGTPFGNEPHPRGIVFPTNTFVTGEVTFHTDHPFWESVVHDTPAHFDQFAARVAMAAGPAADSGAPDAGTTDGGGADVVAAEASVAEAGAPEGGGDSGTTSGGDAGVPTVTMDSLVGVDYLAYTDPFGNPVQWRSCVKDAMGMQFGKSSGRMMFDPQSVPKAPVGPNPTTAGLRDYYDFSTYNQSTQGHWNGVDGLCFVKRNYPSPP
jgi:hypothetical protein